MRRVGMIILCVVLLLAGCTASQPVSRSGFALDTFVSVTVYDGGTANVQAVLDACFAEITRLENLLSVTRETSDIARINAANGAPVTVAEETVQLLNIAVRYGDLSGGAFDITLRPVTALWNFTAEQPTLPDAEELAAAVSTVDYRNLLVDGTHVTLPQGGLDLGGIAKGFIADRVREVLAEHGVVSALIDLGGNIVTCGSKAGEDWKIGVKDPLDTTQLCAIVTGRDMSVVTSGIYERGFTRDGVRYHHLLSPQTGMPVQNELASVTIVCERSVDADALSTACFVLGETRARELLATVGAEALFVRRDGTLSATAGLQYTPA